MSFFVFSEKIRYYRTHMVSINIAHLDYQKALDTITREIHSITQVDCRIEFSADHSQSKIIRDFVGKIFEANNIFSPWRGRLILITDELINNAIEHGSQVGDIDVCIIRANRNAEGVFHIMIEVHDTGKGKDADNAKDIQSIKKDRMSHSGIYMKRRGRGLFHITEKLVDTLEFSESPHG